MVSPTKLIKRYWVIDYTSEKMRIHKTNDPRSEYKVFQFADILSIKRKEETINDKMVIKDRWSFQFSL